MEVTNKATMSIDKSLNMMSITRWSRISSVIVSLLVYQAPYEYNSNSNLLHPSSVNAKEGQAANMKFFEAEKESLGAAVYNEGELSIIRQKLEGIKTKWGKLVDKLNVNIKKKNKQEIQTSLSNAMTSLKVNHEFYSLITLIDSLLFVE